MFWSVHDCEFPKLYLFAEKVEMKHIDVSFLVKCSQKIHNLRMLYLLMFSIESFLSSFLCFMKKITNFFDFFLIFDLVVKE